MPPSTEYDFESLKKLFEDRINGKYKNTYTFNWSSIYNRPPYESTFTPKAAATEQAWLEVVIFVSPWNTKVECSRSDGKMMSKEIRRENLQALFSGLASRGMIHLPTESLNSSTAIYRFRKET